MAGEADGGDPGSGRQVSGSAFLPHECATLATYAGLAAAALDSAAALEEARRQAGTARALLEFATSLADLRGTVDLADRLARAVPSVIDCDGAGVVLADPGTPCARVVASYGFPPAAEGYLATAVIPLPSPAQGSAGVTFHNVNSTDAFARQVLAATGVVGLASVPISPGGEVAGWVVAVVADRSERLRPDADLTDRLRGLAAQAATALSNARLLDQLHHQSLHDNLTGLPNRALILDRAEHMLARARREHTPAAALVLDIDNFKSINDTLGHAAGDELLQAVAARLAGVLRSGDTVGRLGGDEFVVLAEGISLAAGPELVVERLLDVLREPFQVGGGAARALSVSASVGIAVGDRASADELLGDADIAMRRAKSAGKSRYALFDPEMQSEVLYRLALEMDLRDALAQGQYFLVYQPVLDLRSVSVTGTEALLRWRHPTRGLLAPDLFIPILEENGLILEVGRWVLHEACRQAASWHRDGRPLQISVNVSMRQLETDALVEDVRSALAASGLDPGCLIIEITETALMHDADGTVARLTRLKDLGVRIAIDDFGTGYSSLAYLRQFPVDSLKIDRSFVSGANGSSESGALLHTLVQLGRVLQLETLAEGIEDASQLERLQLEQCDSGQGFLFCPPVEPEAMTRFLSGWSVERDRMSLPAGRAAGRGPVRGAAQVLVVDDDPSIRSLLRLVLDDTPDFHVVADASDGLEAIALARLHQPDLILLDLGMPGMDGLEALPLLREVAPGATVLILSGQEPSAVIDQALALGAARFLRKDLDPGELPAALLGAY
ncbi:MAG: EAL domain-containing protein [Mycobacteriales bacterium]